MQLVVTDGVDAPAAVPIAGESPHANRQAMDEDLARRLPGIARYLSVCFPTLRRFDVAVTRDGPRRALEATYAFAGSNVEHLFRSPIAPPCARSELLSAFARLEADLRVALQRMDPVSAAPTRQSVARQRQRLAGLLEQCRAEIAPGIAVACDRLVAIIADLDAALAVSTTDPLAPAAAGLARQVEELVQSLAELIAAGAMGEARRSA